MLQVFVVLQTLVFEGNAKLRARIERTDDGATAVEYGMMVALIAAVIVAVVVLLGKKISSAFSVVNAAM